jgi:hypothetical protein
MDVTPTRRCGLREGASSRGGRRGLPDLPPGCSSLGRGASRTAAPGTHEHHRNSDCRERRRVSLKTSVSASDVHTTLWAGVWQRMRVSNTAREAMILVARAGAVVTVVFYLKGRGAAEPREASLVPLAIFWTLAGVTLIWVIDGFIHAMRRPRPSKVLSVNRAARRTLPRRHSTRVHLTDRRPVRDPGARPPGTRRHPRLASRDRHRHRRLPRPAGRIARRPLERAGLARPRRGRLIRGR